MCDDECRCGKPAEQPHPCPFRADVHNDSYTLCNCCDDCTEQCAMDV